MKYEKNLVFAEYNTILDEDMFELCWFRLFCQKIGYEKIVYNIRNKIILKSIALFFLLMYNEIRKRLLIFHFIYIYSMIKEDLKWQFWYVAEQVISALIWFTH